MASPLKWFRRYQKIMLVVFGVALIAVFGLGSVATMMTPNTGRARVPLKTVVEWDGGSFNENDLRSLRFAHFETIQFLRRLREWSIANQGDSYQQLVSDLPIINMQGATPEQIDREVMLRYLLGLKAEEMGIVVSDAAVMDYLQAFSNDSALDIADLKAIAREAYGGRRQYLEIQNQLKKELAIRHLMQISGVGLPNTPNVTEAWQIYKRMNERIECSVLDFPVEDFVAQVERQPNQTELQRLFEEGQYDYPDPEGKKPGFKQPAQLAISYLTASYEDFVQRAMQDITPEQVQAEYDRLKEEKNSLVMEIVPLESDLQIDGPDAGTKDDDGPPKLQPDDPKKPEGQDQSTEKAAGENNSLDAQGKVIGQEKGDAKGKADADTSEAAKKDDTKNNAEKKSDAKKGGGQKGDDKKGDGSKGDGGQVHGDLTGGVHFVSTTAPATHLQDEQKKSEDNKQDGKKDDNKDAGQEQKQSDDAAKNQKKSGDADPVAGDEKKEVQTDQEKKSDLDKTVEQKSEKSQDLTVNDAQTGQDKQQVPDSANNEPQDTGLSLDDKKPLEPERRVKPLDEDLAKQIRRQLASLPARNAMQNSISEARSVVEDYGIDYAEYLATKDGPKVDRVPEPEPINMQAVADQYKLNYGSVELQDFESLSKDSFGSKIIAVSVATFPGAPPNRQPLSIAQHLFQKFYELEVFRPEDVEEYLGLDSHIIVMTEIQDPSIPEFEDVKDQVVDFWKSQRAAQLAREKAQSVADELAAANTKLIERYANDAQNTGDFSWLSMQLTYPTLPGVNLPGEEFMSTAFSLKLNEYGVAMDMTGENCYVIQKIKEDDTDPKMAQDQFFTALSTSPPQAPFGFLIGRVYNEQMRQVYRDYLDQIEDQHNVRWLAH